MRAALFFLLTLSLLPLKAANYEMQDLQLLYKQKQYEQLLNHITDIPPTKRSSSWQTLLEESVMQQFDHLLQKQETKKILTFLPKYLSLSPKLTDNKIFMQKRAQFGLDYYSPCFSYNDQKCHQEFLDFVTLDPNPNYAFNVAKQVRLRMSDSKAIHYFALAKDTFTATQCQDSDLAMSVEKSLTMKSTSAEAKLAKEIAFGICHDALRPSIKQAIRTNEHGIINSCSIAIKHQSVQGIALSKCKRHLSK